MPETTHTVRILLIEENEIVRFFFRDAFWLHSQQSEYEVVFAKDLAEAMQQLGDPKAEFDIIFLDLALHAEHRGRMKVDPEAGLKLVSDIRARAQWKDAKVVIFSTPANFRLWKKAKQNGADYFLKKDEFLPHHLVDWVAQILKPEHKDVSDYRVKEC